MHNSIQDGAAESNAPKAESVAIRIKIGGETLYLDQGTVDDADALEHLKDKCEATGQPVRISIKHLPQWAPAKRVGALDFFSGLPRYVTYCVAKGCHFNDLFQAIIALVQGTADLRQHQTTRVLALEAAVICYPGALEAACDRLTERLREHGVKGVRTQGLIAEARQIQKQLFRANGVDSADTEPISVRSLLRDAPVSEDIIVPSGWEVSAAGVVRDSEDGGMTIDAPVLLTQRHRNVSTNKHLVTVAWYRGGEWTSQVVDRVVTSNTRLIVDELAPYGLPVTNNNARELVQYFSDFETANLDRLPLAHVTHQLGWQGDKGADGFLCGTTLIRASQVGQGEATEAKGIVFRGFDEGDEKIAAAFRSHGTLNAWRAAMAPIAPFPRVKLALYTALVPPLLSILESPNFVLDFAGVTTCGKTITLRVSAAVWGNPNERDSSAVLGTWDATATYRERASAVQNNLPLILDDTKRARHVDDVAETVYMLAQGRGRGRGTIRGLAAQQTWQTVLITSGEQPVISFSQNGGVRPRVLSLWGSPFEQVNTETGKLVRRLNERVLHHYGHAGPTFVEYLLANRSQWSEWRKLYREDRKQYECSAEGDQFAGRMADHFAAIAMAAWLAHDALDLPWEYSDPIEPLWDELVQGAQEADRALAALRHAYEWAIMHQEEFFSLQGHENGQPSRGWAGRWDRISKVPVPGSKKKPKTTPWLGFVPAKLEEILREAGYEPTSTINTWCDRGWLSTKCDSDGTVRRRIKQRVGCERASVPLYVITGAAVELVAS